MCAYLVAYLVDVSQPDINQDDVHELTGEPAVMDVLNGYNSKRNDSCEGAYCCSEGAM